MIKSQTLIIIILLLIIGFGTWLRFYHLDISPGGLYADEASIGYNAYSILATGKDEYGTSWPLFFRAFGEYKNPVFIYSLVPLIAIFDLTPWTVRAGAAIWGSLTLPLMFIYSRQLTKNTSISLLATFILALMPWHLHYSRIGFEAITMPALILLALIFYRRRRHGWFGLIIGLSFYSYTTARLFAPLLMLILRPRLAGWLGFLIMMLPLFSWNRQYPGSLTARFNQISVFSDRAQPIVVGERIIKTYFAHWQPDFLFNRGDTTLRHSSGNSSELLIVWFSFFISGLWFARKQHFIILMLAIFPLAAALTQTAPIATRTIQATPFFALVIAYGVYAWKKPIIILIFGLLTTLEFSHYYFDLIYRYPNRVSQPWHGFDADLGPTISAAYQQHLENQQPLYLSNKIEQVQIHSLFWTKTELPTFNPEQARPQGLLVFSQSDCPIDPPSDYCLVFNP